MERKKLVGLFCNVVGNGIAVPTLLTMLKFPAPIIAGVAGVLILAAFLWGFAPYSLGWRRRMLPVGLMVLGAMILAGGAALFYFQKPAQAAASSTTSAPPATSQAEEQTAPPTAPKVAAIEHPVAAPPAPIAVQQPSGDTYNITNNGPGTAIGRVENLNIGKQPFAMTPAIMADVLAQLDRSKPVTLYSIGPSKAATEQLAAYLAQNGVEVGGINIIGQWNVVGIDVPQVPVIINGPAPGGGRVAGSTPIVVDVSK